MISIFWTAFFLILFFAGTIFVHEYGHYLAARKRGLKIEAFSIGFGPKLFGWTNAAGVEFKVCALPLGGYVRLPQLGDGAGLEGDAESEGQNLPPLSWADKVIVSVMGAVFNVLFAIVLSFLLWGIGQYKHEAELTTTIGYVHEHFTITDPVSGEIVQVPSPAYTAGLQPGDVIRKIDGKSMNDWEDISYAIILGSGRSEDNGAKLEIEIERNGQAQDFTIFPRLEGMDQLREIGIEPRFTLEVAAILPDSPAEYFGLQTGDRIVAFNGEPLHAGVVDLLSKLEGQHGKTCTVEILREGVPQTLSIIPARNAETGAVNLGFAPTSPVQFVRINPITQVEKGFRRVTQTLSSLVNPKSDVGLRHLSGPVGISYVFYRFQDDFPRILGFAILLNISLAVFNLLPIPVLDGGHIVFATIQAIRGKPLPPQAIAATQSIFVLLILCLFAYVLFYDTRRVIHLEKQELEYRQQAEDREGEPSTPAYIQEDFRKAPQPATD